MNAPDSNARPRTAKQVSGQAGEDAALAYLQGQGMTLVTRNFRCKTGEIDLIMQDRASVVFVEVRKRASAEYGGAAASITPAKQRRLLRAAQFYLLRYRSQPPCRFDVIAIDDERITWLKSAIEA